MKGLKGTLKLTAIFFISILITTSTFGAFQRGYNIPKRGSKVRGEILNSIRSLVEVVVREPVSFVVKSIAEKDGYSVSLVEPIKKNGKKIRWKELPLDESEKNGQVFALMRNDGAGWRIMELEFGQISKLDEWLKKYPEVPNTLIYSAALASQ